LHRYAEAEEAVGIRARLPMAEASGGILMLGMISAGKAGRTAEAEPALRAAADAVHWHVKRRQLQLRVSAVAFLNWRSRIPQKPAKHDDPA